MQGSKVENIFGLIENGSLQYVQIAENRLVNMFFDGDYDFIEVIGLMDGCSIRHMLVLMGVFNRVPTGLTGSLYAEMVHHRTKLASVRSKMPDISFGLESNCFEPDGASNAKKLLKKTASETLIKAFRRHADFGTY